MRPPAHGRPAALAALSVSGLLLVATAVVLVLGGLGGGEDRAQAQDRGALRPVTIVWAGDLTLGSSYGNPPKQGWSLLQGVARFLRAGDLTAVNLEGQLATTGTSKCAGSDSGTCFAFRGPPANAAALKRAGVDLVNLANNHAFDFGAPAMGETVRAVRRHGVEVTGRPGEIAIREIEGARVAFVGFAAYKWSSPINDLPYAARLVREAGRRAHLVVVLFHAGAEGQEHTRTPVGQEEAYGELRGDVRAFARTAIDAGADLVLGSGPHVLRGMELYKDRLVAYSLGNLAGYKNFATTGVSRLSAILQVTLGPDGRAVVGRLESLALSRDGIPARDGARAAAELMSRVGRQDFGTRAVTVTSTGALKLPGRPSRSASPAG